jgi:hypothetical protein
MTESWFNDPNIKLVEAFKEASDKVYKRKKFSTPDSLMPKISFIRKGMNKDATIEALWQAYENHGSKSDPKNYNFVKHFLNADPVGETDEGYNKVNSAANDAFVNMINGLYSEPPDEKSFKDFLNKEGMLDKMKGFVAVPMSEAMRNVDRFKSAAYDYSPLYKSDGTIDQEKIFNVLFKDDIATTKATKEEQAKQQKAQEKQIQEDYTSDPSGDTGASLGTGFGSMGAPYEVQPLRQSPVWLTRDQEKSVADFIASRALQEYKK